MGKEYQVVRPSKPSPIATHTSAAAWFGPAFETQEEAEKYIQAEKRKDPSSTYFVREVEDPDAEAS